MHSFLLLLSKARRLPFLLRAFLLRKFYKKTFSRIGINFGKDVFLADDLGSLTESFLRSWARYVPWNPLFLFCTKYNFESVRKLPLAARLQHHFLHEEKEISSFNLDLLYSPFGKISPLPPTSPTLLYFEDIRDHFFPEFFSLKDLSGRRNQYRTAHTFATHMLVPSHFSKKSIMACLGIPEERISVVPLPIIALPKKNSFPKNLQDLHTPFLYYPADNDVHKNHRRLFLAVAKLVTRGWKGRLICTGEKMASDIDLEAMAQELGIRNQFVHLGKMSRQETSWLYRHATMLIFPSLFEGFGTPIIEAFEAMLPVLCSGTSSLPELGGDAALYCNPFDVDDIAEKIWTLWNDKTLCQNLIKRGSERKKNFATKTIIKEHLAIFEKIISEACPEKSFPKLLGTLTEVHLPLTEKLYRESAHSSIQDAIPARTDWFLPQETAGLKNHGSSFSLRKLPTLKSATPISFSEKDPTLPLHFFTIVYNGMPFIQKHLEVFGKLSLPWHWHIIEGAATLHGDTSWSVATGGRLPKETKFLSDDGTKEYLDRIAQKYPEHISLYRKNDFWLGKLEMISAPLASLPNEAILWEIDVDEFWNLDQIMLMMDQFSQNPDRTGASFYCRFFLKPGYIADNIGFYGNNPSSEWRRVWHYKKGDFWKSHEPPSLLRETAPGEYQDVMKLHPFTHEETWRMGLLFDHFAFVEAKQLKFKESYYGYHGAFAAWEKMVQSPDAEILAPLHLSWIKDPIWVFKI